MTILPLLLRHSPTGCSSVSSLACYVALFYSSKPQQCALLCHNCNILLLYKSNAFYNNILLLLYYLWLLILLLSIVLFCLLEFWRACTFSFSFVSIILIYCFHSHCNFCCLHQGNSFCSNKLLYIGLLASLHTNLSHKISSKNASNLHSIL